MAFLLRPEFLAFSDFKCAKEAGSHISSTTSSNVLR